MEVTWNAISSILNHRLMIEMTFHDVLHGLRAGSGMGTATLEARLIQQLTAMREAILFEVFLDLQKAYDALDQDRCLGILVVWGFGPKMIRLCGHTGTV